MKTITLAQSILAFTLCLAPSLAHANHDSGNSVNITQSGAGDLAVVVQQGKDIDCTISQTAAYDTAIVVQSEDMNNKIVADVKNSDIRISIVP